MRVTPFSYLEQRDAAAPPPVVDGTRLFFSSNANGTYDGSAFENILKTDLTGSQDTTFQAGLATPGFGNSSGGYGSLDEYHMYIGMKDSANQLKVHKIDKTSGHVSASSATTFNGDVLGATVHGDYVYVTGTFTSPFNRIMRLNKSDLSDASTSTFFGSGFNGTTLGKAIVFDSSYAYIGGDFTSYDGSTASRVAKIDLSTGNLDSTFQSNISGLGWSFCRAIELYDGNLYFGIWSGTGAYSRTTTGAANSTFNVGTGFTGASGGKTRDIAIDGNGRICYVGEFSAIDGTSVGGCAVLQTDGSLYPTFHNNSGTEFGTTFNGRADYYDGKWYFARIAPTSAGPDWDGTTYSNPLSVNDDGTINNIFGSGVSPNTLTFLSIG